MQEVFKTISRATDLSDLSERERIHVPVVELPDVVMPGEMFPVTVKVGKCPHDMDPGHYVQYIDLYADRTPIARVSFTPTGPLPKMTYFLVLEESTVIRAIAFCNLHGFWESEARIRVE
jgi:superoxide reductase